MTLTCCQDHILTENIWFVWSETLYSGDERRCYRCGTNERTTERTVKIELLSQWKLEAEFRKNMFMTSNTLQGLKGQPVGRWEESWSSSILARSRSLYFQGAGFFLSPFYQHFFRFLNELGVETASLVDAFLGKPSLFLGRSLSSF